MCFHFVLLDSETPFRGEHVPLGDQCEGPGRVHRHERGHPEAQEGLLQQLLQHPLLSLPQQQFQHQQHQQQ